MCNPETARMCIAPVSLKPWVVSFVNKLRSPSINALAKASSCPVSTDFKISVRLFLKETGDKIVCCE